MTKMSKGPRSGSRMVMKKSIKNKGMPKVNDMMKTFNIGDRAAIVINSAVPNGMPHHDFQGITGVITGMQGSCYILSFKIGHVEKKVIAAPVHLRKVQ